MMTTGPGAGREEGRTGRGPLAARAALALLLAVAARPADAEPGNGIRFGGAEGRLHPFLELQLGYDSNVFVKPSGVGTVGDAVLHVRPGLTLEVPAHLLAVDLSAALDWAQYLGLVEAGSRDLSRLYADAKLGLKLYPRGTIGLQLDDTYRLSNRPQSLTAPGNVVTNYNALELRAPWRPGGGALGITASGSWAMEAYQRLLLGSCEPDNTVLCDVNRYGYNQLGAGLGVSWHFLPRTSLVLDGSWFHRVPNSTAVASDASGYRGMAGVTGLVTSHFAATLKGGWGSTLSVSPGQGIATWLATAEGEWLPSETTSVKAGYAHDFALDPGVPVYEAHRVLLSGRMLLGGRLSLGARATVDLLGYVQGGGSTMIVQAAPVVGMELSRWLRTEATVGYTDRISSSEAKVAVPGYSKVEAWLKVTATY